MKSPRTWVPKSSNVSLKASPTTTTTGLLPMPDGASKNVSMTHRRAEYVVGGGIENAAGGRWMPIPNSCCIAAIRYEPGQYSKTHYDFMFIVPLDKERVRILTSCYDMVLLYIMLYQSHGFVSKRSFCIVFNDVSKKVVAPTFSNPWHDYGPTQEGPHFDSIRPSVLNDDPNWKCGRTEYRALPVLVFQDLSFSDRAI